MNKIVISGSSSLQDKVNYWREYFKNKNYEILDYPKPIEKENYEKELPKIYKDFYTALENTEVFFLMNEEKNGIKGYIGASAIAELTYVVMLNLIHNKNIDIYILNMPSQEVSSYDEVKFWLDMGWIKLYEEDKFYSESKGELNKELVEYIKLNIFNKYERYYSHGMLHIQNVINTCIMLAEYYNLDKNMAYVIAAYHDIGLNVDRKNHEYESGKILNNDLNLRKYFSDEQIQIMKEAVEDHRGSKKEEPRNIYGKILSDSDRDFDVEILAKRQMYTSIKNYPELTTFEEQFERCYEYIMNRINDTGHFNLWTNNPILIQRREKFEQDYFNKEYRKTIYEKEYNKIYSEGIIEKMKNYYLDY